MAFIFQSNSLGKLRLIMALIILPAFVLAAQTEKRKVSPWEEKFILMNIAISEFFDEMADKIDNFFIEKKMPKKKNETFVRIENLTNSVEGQTVENATHLNVNLRLPKVEEYFKLKFTTYDEAEERRSRRRVTTPIARRRTYGASAGLFKSWGTLRTAFQPRIELQDPLKVSHSLSFERTIEFNSFEFDPKIEFFANPDKGTGIFLALNFEIFLDETYTILLVNEGEYEEKRNMFSTSIGVSLVQTFNEKMAMSYSFFTFSNNRPNYHLDGYSLSVAWNQLLYKKVLDYQLVPHLDFTRERGFKGQAGLALNINLNF